MSSGSKRLGLALAALLVAGVAGCGSAGEPTAFPLGRNEPILVDGKCPDGWPIPNGDGAAHRARKGQTVPGGARDAEIVICHYEGSGSAERPKSTMTERVLGRDEPQRVAALIAKLNRLPPDLEPYNSCPSGNPRTTWIVVRYPDGSETPLYFNYYCGDVLNYRDGTEFQVSGRLRAELESLAGDRSRPA